MKKLISLTVAFLVMLQGFMPLTTVFAATVAKPTAQNDAYSYIVSATTGTAIQQGAESSSLVSLSGDANDYADNVLFNVEKTTIDSKEYVQFASKDKSKRMTVNGTNLVTGGYGAASTLTAGAWEAFQIEDATTTLEGAVKIKNYDGKYLKNDGNGKVVFGDTTGTGEDYLFYVISPKYEDTTMYFEQASTGKYIKANGAATELTVDGTKTDDKIGDDLRWTPVYGTYNNQEDVTFVSKKYPNTRWLGGNVTNVKQIDGNGFGGWESIHVVANGDGTISFTDTNDNKYFTVANGKLSKTDSTTTVNDAGKFKLHTVLAPNAATNLSSSEIGSSSFTLNWDKVKESLYTGYEVYQSTTSAKDGAYSKVGSETNKTSMNITGLTKGETRWYKVRTVSGTDSSYKDSAAFSVTTAAGEKPASATNLSYSKADGTITWDPVDGATSYEVYRCDSGYGEYTKIGTTTTSNYKDANPNASKYKNNYKVKAVNDFGTSALSTEFASLERTMFGSNVYIFAPTDDTVTINKVIKDIYNTEKNEQFGTDHADIYFKPGDYTKGTATYEGTNYTGIDTTLVGFYTQVAGLGKTPYDVKINNIACPSALANNNATCNFWRSAENLSVMDTGYNPAITDDYGNKCYNPERLQWSVAQAAPMRRIYSQRQVNFDWNYGWASGGYAADCRFDSASGTASGQQFYTRNSVIKGTTKGTTLNNFLQGVVASDLPTASTGTSLLANNGYTNWSQKDGVTTNITTTKELREKPFLYMDDGEYKVFVPSIKKDSKGASWSENDMGEGKSISIDDFYIAKEGDKAATINAQLAAGKNIFYTPGVYNCEEAIHITKADTVVLGSGMAALIPTNSDGVAKIDDVDGVTFAGFMLDAGTYSKNLVQVGNTGDQTSHASDPTLLADLFFRVGGTTSKATTTDDALIINSNDVLCDHFWIWRADHGDGVSWTGNAAKHGLIVNGDNVTCYALFNEHFEEYDTLWNGENGSTYFYQNEKCYDPISQDSWMSHDGKAKGYAAYKVSNTVKKHYAVGLGIYNVFINTGPTRDSSSVSIELENAMEVPNTPGVLIEDACTQTFAKDDGAYEAINHIIDGTGESVSSGGTKGEGWSRKYILNYCNGVCNRGTVTNPVTEKGLNPYNEEGDLDYTKLKVAYEAYKGHINDGLQYTEESFTPYKKVVDLANDMLNGDKPNRYTQVEVDGATNDLKTTYEALAASTADYTALDEAVSDAEDLMNSSGYLNDYYTEDCLTAFDTAYKNANAVDRGMTKAHQSEVDDLTKALKNAMKAMKLKKADYTYINRQLAAAKAIVDGDDYKNDNYLEPTKEEFDIAYAAAKQIKTTYDVSAQGTIDARAVYLFDAIKELQLKPSDQTDINQTIKIAEAIVDSGYFKNQYYEDVSKFLDCLNIARDVKEYDIDHQDKVDTANENLKKAIAGLNLKDADYQKLLATMGEAAMIIKSDNYKNDKFVLKTVQIFNKAVKVSDDLDKGLKIPEQATVDNVNQELIDAINQLRLKGESKTDDPTPVTPIVTPTNPTTPTTTPTTVTPGVVTPDTPTIVPTNDSTTKTPVKSKTGTVTHYVRTGDDTDLGMMVTIGILAASAGIMTLSRGKKHEDA